MADRVLVDTDVLVDHLRGDRRLEFGSERPALISTITRAELFADPREQWDAVRALLSAFDELPVDGRVAELGGAIRRTASIPLPDALIAAGALSAGAAVLTANSRHLERVDGLAVETPG